MAEPVIHIKTTAKRIFAEKSELFKFRKHKKEINSMAKINVKDTEITIMSVEERDYISLTDMANAKESESRAADIIKNWLRSRIHLNFGYLGANKQPRF
jgi:hypothetical protein